MALSIPKRLGGGTRTKSHARAPGQEKRSAARLGGQQTKASGAGKFEKGDVRVRGLLRLDAKTTKHASFRVTAEMIAELEQSAAQAGEVPVFEIEVDNEGSPRSCYVIPTWALDDIVQLVAQKEGS